MKDRVLNGFIDGVYPFFSGNAPVAQSEKDEVPREDMPHQKVYEWDLRQDCITLLKNDLLGTVKALLPPSITDGMMRFLYTMDIYFNFDGTDMEPVVIISSNMPVNTEISVGYPSHRSEVILWDVLEQVLLSVDGSKRIRPKQFPLSSIKAMIKTAGIYMRYMIRGPAFIKNLPLLFSNKRN